MADVKYTLDFVSRTLIRIGTSTLNFKEIRTASHPRDRTILFFNKKEQLIKRMEFTDTIDCYQYYRAVQEALRIMDEERNDEEE